MDTIKLSDDGSPRDRNRPSALQDRYTIPAHDRENRRPPVDWTGIQYKSPRECMAAGIDYGHIGRESSAGRGKDA